MENVKQNAGSTIHYWTYNPGKKQIIIMIHGFTGDHHGFQKIIPLLTEYTLIVPDLPGSGKSSITPKDWSIDGIARLTNEFVESLELKEPPILFGHSMGGLVVASMVHQAPELYNNKVILLSPVPTKIGFPDSRWLGARLGELQYLIGYAVPVLGPKLIKSKWLTKIIANQLITTKDSSVIQFTYEQMWENLNRICSIKLYYHLERDINRRGTLDYAGELAKKDLLIVNGNKDKVVPLHRIQPVAEHTRAKFLVIEDVGHDAHYEKASEVASSVIEFIKYD